MGNRQFGPTSVWLAALIALLVGLGTQVLLEGVIPVSLGGPGGYVHVGWQSIWVSDAAIRFASFATGGYVSVLLVRALPLRLAVLLVLVAILGTVFVQFPAKLALVWLVVWSAAAPFGALLGAWVTNAKRSAA